MDSASVQEGAGRVLFLLVMVLIYDILLFFYHLAVNIYSPFNKKASKWIAGRKGIIDKLKKQISIGDEIIWFHCASLGEFEQGRPIIERIKADYPQYKILISFFSPSGYEVRKDYAFADYICYLPKDTGRNAREFIEVVSPKLVFFVKYEFWYHHLNAVRQKEIPLYCISAIFREDQVFFKWYGSFFVEVLKMFSHIYVQDEESKSKISELGVDAVSVAGDTRFDRVKANSQEVMDLPVLDHFKGDSKLLIAGSTWKEDEESLVRLINTSDLDLKYVIAPHEISQTNIKRLEDSLQVASVRYSEAKSQAMDKYKVLIIDNMGLLSSIYRYASIVYVGGAFGSGLHNILEPAVYGKPIIFGPDHKKFKEAGELISDGGAFSISNFDELKRKVRFLLADPYIIKIASEISKTYVNKNTGATDKILGSIPMFANPENRQ